MKILHLKIKAAKLREIVENDWREMRLNNAYIILAGSELGNTSFQTQSP